MDLINNHVVLPFLADWDKPVSLSLKWDNEVDASLFGYEARGAMREYPRPTLSFSLAQASIAYTAAVRQLFNAALTSGMVAVPFHGRASWIDAVNGAALTIAPNPWTWNAADPAIIINAARQVAIASVASFVAPLLTVTAAPAIPIARDDSIYPVLFGRLVPGDASIQTYIHGDAPIQVVGGAFPINSVVPDICKVTGCTNIAASNFNPAANVDDGSCVLP